MSTRLVMFLAILAFAAPALRAAAQSEDGDVARARAAFEEANAAADADRFADARILFEESLRLSPRPATALNLAHVLRSLGAITESEGYLRGILAGAYGPLNQVVRTRTEALLGELPAAYGHLTVELRGAERARLRVDEGEERALEAGAGELRLDPGDHVVAVRTDSGPELTRSVRLASGERVRLVIDLADQTHARGDESSGGSDDAIGWIVGTLIAVVVVGAAVGVGVGFALADGDAAWADVEALVRF
ncbi:MAG: hypothetical protein AB7S26_36720 [Sandaracinaceae bacterium]